LLARLTTKLAGRRETKRCERRLVTGWLGIRSPTICYRWYNLSAGKEIVRSSARARQRKSSSSNAPTRATHPRLLNPSSATEAFLGN
jgi:hypothetical protein